MIESDTPICASVICALLCACTHTWRQVPCCCVKIPEKSHGHIAFCCSSTIIPGSSLGLWGEWQHHDDVCCGRELRRVIRFDCAGLQHHVWCGASCLGGSSCLVCVVEIRVTQQKDSSSCSSRVPSFRYFRSRPLGFTSSSSPTERAGRAAGPAQQAYDNTP